MAQRGPAAPAGAPQSIVVQPNVGGGGIAADVKFSPDGSYLVEGDGQQLKLWDIRTGRPLRTLDHFTYFQQFVFIDGGKRILSVHKDGQIRTWDPSSGRMIDETKLPGVEGSQLDPIFHQPQRSLIVLPFENGPIVLWDYARRQRVTEFHFNPAAKPQDAGGSPDAVWLSPDGSRLVAIEDATIKFFDVRARRATRTIKLPDKLQAASSAGLLNDRYLIAKTASADCDADVVLVDLGSGEPRISRLDPAPRCKRKSSGEVDDPAASEGIYLHFVEAQSQLYLARKGVQGLKAFDVATGRPVVVAATLAQQAGKLTAIDDRLTLAAFEVNQTLRIAELTNGRELAVLKTHGTNSAFAVASADGRRMMQIHYDKEPIRLATWPIDGGAPRFNSVRMPQGFEVMHAVPDADRIVGAKDKREFVVLSAQSGAVVSRFTLSEFDDLHIARLSPDGRRLFVKGWLKATRPGGNGQISATYMVDVATGRTILRFSERKPRSNESNFDFDAVTSFAVSPDGKSLAVGWLAGTAEIWSMESLRLVRSLDRAGDQTTSLAFSSDNRYLIGGSRDSGIFVWDLRSGKMLRELKRDVIAGHVNTGSVAISHDGELVAAGPGQRAVSSGDAGRERRVQVWETATGRRRFMLSGHEQNVTALAFTQDGKWIVSGSIDGTIRYWDRSTGQLGATFASAPDGRWVIVTDKGFFAASADAGDLLSVVRGFEATSIEQLWQSLYAPDLVRSHIAGDPDGEVKSAAATADLASILDGGPAPEATITAPAAGSLSATELVKVEARIADRGKGIGRIEWRVNGVTVAVVQKPTATGAAATLVQEIPLDPGNNVIEVVAYTASNLLASIPARTTVRLEATTAMAKPRLHILAVGINDYIDQGWAPPGAPSATRFPKLELAVKDATTLAADLKQAAATLYDDVRVTLALDQGATRAALDATITRLAGEIHPRDTFILYVAAHGKSENGRFYVIPQDFHSGPDALARTAIGQDMLQDWLANRIKARKALILLDTCESGAVIAGHLRSRTEAAASEAAVGRLHEATGRPVLTAAASGKPALEGFDGHGVFTWALLDALRHADANGNGSIELLELVSHVQDHVPRISAELQGAGRAAIAVVARASSETEAFTQTARFGSRGENYQLTRVIAPSTSWKAPSATVAMAPAAPTAKGTAAVDDRRSGAPNSPSPPASSQPRTFKSHIGYALQAGDLENIPGHDRTSCEQLCRGRAGCVAYVYDRWNRWCHLKASVTTLRRHPKYETFVDTSLPAVAISSSPEQMMRLRGKSFRDDTPYATRAAASYEACERACTDEGRCSGFSFVRAGSSCRLFSSLSEYFSASGIDSGFKEQDPLPSR